MLGILSAWQIRYRDVLIPRWFWQWRRSCYLSNLHKDVSIGTSSTSFWYKLAGKPLRKRKSVLPDMISQKKYPLEMWDFSMYLYRQKIFLSQPFFSSRPHVSMSSHRVYAGVIFFFSSCWFSFSSGFVWAFVGPVLLACLVSKIHILRSYVKQRYHFTVNKRYRLVSLIARARNSGFHSHAQVLWVAYALWSMACTKGRHQFKFVHRGQTLSNGVDNWMGSHLWKTSLRVLLGEIVA